MMMATIKISFWMWIISMSIKCSSWVHVLQLIIRARANSQLNTVTDDEWSNWANYWRP